MDQSNHHDPSKDARDPHVSEVLIVLGMPPACDMAAMLDDRPGLTGARTEQHTYPWGNAWVQYPFPPTSQSRPLSPERMVAGRPSLRGPLANDRVSVLGWLEARDGLTSDPGGVGEALSGMYAVFEFDETGIRVLTDRMGFRPVYTARDTRGNIRAIGTHAESVAMASGTGDQIDPVSVAELLVHNDITFPFTTRTTMRELPPASLSTIAADGRTMVSRTLWEPVEPAQFPAPAAMRTRMADAMREAARDITRGCDQIGVLLSGGADSRAVLGAVLDAVGNPQRVTGLTYVTRENNETRVAGRVAASAGCRHELVRRDEHYFPRLLRRGLALLGCELRGNCHGLGVADAGLADRFDVIVGGQLSDTMLKDHFMDITTRALHRAPTLKQRIRRSIPGLGSPLPVSPPGHTTGREQLQSILTDTMRDEVRQRRSDRLKAVQTIRPRTGAVWHRFWPCSRQDDSAHTLGNARIMVGDTLFAHTAIIEAASDLSLEARVDGVQANRSITDVCGRLASVENANTGLPIDASGKEIRKAQKARAIRPGTAQAAESDDAPWNAVETSWVDPELMQRRSPEWIGAREGLAHSPALAILDTIVARGASDLIGSYQDDLPSNINHIAVQIALWLDQTLNHPPAPPESITTPAQARRPDHR